MTTISGHLKSAGDYLDVLSRTPGHADVCGNKRADSLALKTSNIATLKICTKNILWALRDNLMSDMTIEETARSKLSEYRVEYGMHSIL